MIHIKELNNNLRLLLWKSFELFSILISHNLQPVMQMTVVLILLQTKKKIIFISGFSCN